MIVVSATSSLFVCYSLASDRIVLFYSERRWDGSYLMTERLQLVCLFNEFRK